ncbi:LytTR family DNA-binding domain-containing protein [Flammeovirgaceae bacterium SG7u.111]|nr:LytTR family DNA-binding domain-containing protein [Flammeovirgaceae bacterium SG7u.132]WPO37305.1 LytTR family DNA-binding domain-containing protein [Flammeovirgaceae bacterium SG7u.111]
MRCIVVDDDQVSRTVINDYIERTDGLELAKDFDNAISALQYLKSEAVDLIFLDVEMPKMSGMDLVSTLKILDNLPHVIIMTSKKEYAFDAFKFELTGFLLKDIKYAEFLEEVGKVKQVREQSVIESDNQEAIYVKADNKIQRVNLSDMLFIEALSDYVIINTAQKRLVVHSTMKGIEKRLASNDFARVHRSYIVNISKIESIEDMNISMQGKSIPIGSSYKNDFLAKLNLL